MYADKHHNYSSHISTHRHNVANGNPANSTITSHTAV